SLGFSQPTRRHIFCRALSNFFWQDSHLDFRYIRGTSKQSLHFSFKRFSLLSLRLISFRCTRCSSHQVCDLGDKGFEQLLQIPASFLRCLSLIPRSLFALRCSSQNTLEFLLIGLVQLLHLPYLIFSFSFSC